jgi:hypothetical protein
MSSPSWYRPTNPVTVIQGGVDVNLPADEQLIAAGTTQVTPNSEIPAYLLAAPPAGVSTQIKTTIENITPGANP